MSADHRQIAKSDIERIITRLREHASPRQKPDAGGQQRIQSLIEECEALTRAIAAFHMEGIRFRMFNVDRLLHQRTDLPSEIVSLFADARRELEAAGFHTRSHQAPAT
jgi:hypothetical protein